MIVINHDEMDKNEKDLNEEFIELKGDGDGDDENTCKETGKSNNQFVPVCCSVTLCDGSPGLVITFIQGWRDGYYMYDQ